MYEPYVFDVEIMSNLPKLMISWKSFEENFNYENKIFKHSILVKIKKNSYIKTSFRLAN